MFADLSDRSIQPQSIDVRHIPEIEISEYLKSEVQKLLEEEENNYAKVYDRTAVVQTEKNYVFFSNHWLYLAVLCKKYAEALKPYGDFFDRKIRGNWKRLNIFISGEFDSDILKELLPNETDRERMIKYVMGDEEFRPGKSLINGNKARSIKDVFASCVLKKIAVPDASSAYLGNLIYYLTKRPDLFNAIEMEVKGQVGNVSGVLRLSSQVKDCAKEIIDYIYKLDAFGRISSFFVNTGMSIKVNTEAMGDIMPAGKFLRYMFVLPESKLYDSDLIDGMKTRVFNDREYDVWVNGGIVKCRLTTQWKDAELEENGDGNFLKALILVVNRCYEDVLEIKGGQGEYYLYTCKNNFKLQDLPEIFTTSFSRRYITSLLAKPFVILTGNSGTGKTRIAKQFAEYLEKKTEDGRKNWLIVPVGADWTDNAKVLGFYNPLANNGAGKYEKTGIVELIERANRYRDIPYFIILDEMNLSHVERYFSDFLSHMETPDSSFELDGYKDEYGNEAELRFPANLFVVGTVNIDETTYMFSPKVLDRANVVEFKPEKENVLALFTLPAHTEKIRPANDGTSEAFLKLAKQIRSGKCGIDNLGHDENSTASMESVKELFGLVYEGVEKQGFEFAYRTVREIRQYISAAYEISGSGHEFVLRQAIDEQLLQKVLPKIHGNKKEIGELLDTLEIICKREEMPLELSLKKIEQMKGKLASVQYASFI